MTSETKNSRAKLSNVSGMLRSPRNGKGLNKLSFNVALIILAGVSALILMIGRENGKGRTGIIHDFKRMISVKEQQQHWNYSSYSFHTNVSNWDEQRAIWIEEHPSLRPRAGERPRVLIVTGSSPEPCEPSILSHIILRAGKNKLDYCRMHDMEFYYSISNPDAKFSDWWVKLPVIQTLMLQHPEVEWIWWLDADAIITDMSFEPPFAELDQHNLVLYGVDRLVYASRSWTGLSTANYMIRNCQWSLDLLDAWASMGTATARNASGKFQSELLADRPFEFPGDDQSALVAMLVYDKSMSVGKQKWAPMVKLVQETEYSMSGNWTVFGPKLEELTLNGGQPVPFVTHFAGCLASCTARIELSSERLNACMEQLGRAFDFADNQVYEQLGFQPRNLGSSLEPLIRNPSELVDNEADFIMSENGEKEYMIPPKYTDWNERRQEWMKKHPPTKRDEVLLVSGSGPKPCAGGKVGSQMLVRGFKNLIDYGRINGVKIFYNNAAVDKDLSGWWSKLPLLKILMLKNPSVEWIWWMDSDAVFTDMDFQFPFERYNVSGYNMVMYGSEHEVFEEKSYKGINTGNFLIRNCQWSLDLFDRWASFGATKELRVKNEELLNNFLLDRPHGWNADDQCVLVYLLITEREKWASQVLLETSIIMSGYWASWMEKFDDDILEPEHRPFVTHFAGCKPCHEEIHSHEGCLTGMDKTYNYGDDQVLKRYGLRHEQLNSSSLQKLSTFISNPPQHIEKEDVHAESLESKEDVHAESLEAKGDVHGDSVKAKEDVHAESLEAKEDVHAGSLEAKEDVHAESLEAKGDMHAESLEAKEDVDATKEHAKEVDRTKNEKVGTS